jgi:hypothetical protein
MGANFRISNSLSNLSDVTTGTSGIHLYIRVSVILFRCLLHSPHDHDPHPDEARMSVDSSSLSSNSGNGATFLTKLRINISSHNSKTITLSEQQNFIMLNNQYIIMDEDKVAVTEAAANLRGKNGERITPPKDKGMKRHAGGTAVSGGMAGLLRLCNGSGRCRYVRQLSRQGSR